MDTDLCEIGYVQIGSIRLRPSKIGEFGRGMGNRLVICKHALAANELR